MRTIRISRMPEDKYVRQLSLIGALKADAEKLQDSQARELVSAFANLLLDVTVAHRLEDVYEKEVITDAYSYGRIEFPEATTEGRNIRRALVIPI
jgi:hypothetical protein